VLIRRPVLDRIVAGWQTTAFNEPVRTLTSLGLTVSHRVGDELSPRGRALRAHLRS